MPVTTEISPAPIVGKDKENIGALGSGEEAEDDKENSKDVGHV
jgi:hypothetical protein